MWYLLIAEIVFASLFTVLQTPRKWWKNKISLVIVSLFHIVGFSSVVILLWFFYKLKDPFIKEVIIKIETFYLSFVIIGFVLAMFRAFLFYATRHYKNSRFKDIAFSSTTYMTIVSVLTIIFVIVGTKSSDSIKTTTYKIDTNKFAQSFKIALVSDIHLGAGANQKNLDDMVRLVNDMQADCLLIVGDSTDSGSSLTDLEYFSESLKKIKTKYGIYAIEGNHEEQSHYDLMPYLNDSNVTFLCDEAISINDKVTLIGLDYRNNDPLTAIKTKYDVDNDSFVVTLKHNPHHLKTIADDCDLVLCGHTHGYQYPFTAVTTPFVSDMRFGMKRFSNMTAITSSGLSEWGIHAKWPSQSEVVEIIIN